MAERDADRTCSKRTGSLRDVFANGALVATRVLRAPDVEGWDSLGNVNLFLAIEQEFGVRFGAGEIGKIGNVGELVDLIGRKL